MKRKHPHNSSGKGCQIISKFFKTSSTQDVKDAENLGRRDTDSILMSKPKLRLAGPVLQKLTKLRESLSRRALCRTNPPGIPRNEKKENMEVSSENQPQTGANKSNTEIIEINTEDSERDRINTTSSLQDNTVISISSDSSVETLSKSQEFSESWDIEKEHTTAEEKYGTAAQKSKNMSFESQDELIEDNKDMGFVNTSDMEISFKTSSFIADDIEESCVKSDENIVDSPEQGSSDEEIAMDTEIEACVDNMYGRTDNYESKEQVSQGVNEDINISETMYDTTSVTNERPINIEPKVLPCKSITDSDATYDSQFSQATVNNQGNDEASDSDDDLLSPPSFLYENKIKPEVCTPEKVITPLGASPMSSPVKPVKDLMKELEDRKYRFSLSKMLKEKNKGEVKNATLVKMEADLDAGIKKGGIKVVTDMISEDETDSEFDDGKDLSKCKLPKEVSKHLVKVSNFSEELVGEDIFPELDNRILSFVMPCLNFPNPFNEDTFLMKLISSKPDDIKEIINGEWLMQFYLKRPCPAPVAEWVFHIMCFYPDTFVSSQCFKTLWALLRAGTEDQGGVPRGIRGMTWVPSIKNIIHVLQHYGATLETITPNQLKSARILPLVNEVVKNEEKFDVSKSNAALCRPRLVFLMGQLIQFITHCLHMASLNYTVNDLHLLLVISCRLSLDLRLQEFLFDIEMFIFEILNCFGESQWEEQIKELPLLLVHLSTNHRDVLHTMHIMPPSERGSQLRQLTCVILLKLFIKEFNSEHIITDTQQRTEILQKLNKTTTLEVSKLLSLVDEIQPQQSSSYHLLHTIISLFDLAIGNEDHSPSERAELKKLASKLGSLNGNIKDPRAAYLDRTKVKDLLVRTVNKIHFLVQSIEPPKERELSEYFETNSSDYEVHTLEETSMKLAPGDENVSSPEEGSASSPGGSSPPSPGVSSPPSPGVSSPPSPGGSSAPSPGGSNDSGQNGSDKENSMDEELTE